MPVVGGAFITLARASPSPDLLSILLSSVIASLQLPALFPRLKTGGGMIEDDTYLRERLQPNLGFDSIKRDATDAQATLELRFFSFCFYSC